jgi:hypothetical protein
VPVFSSDFELQPEAMALQALRPTEIHAMRRRNDVFMLITL